MAPELTIAEIVGIAVFAAVIISSPFLIFIALREIKSASVPLPTATPYFDLYFDKNFFSKFLNSFPKNTSPLERVTSIFFNIFFFNFLYSLL